MLEAITARLRHAYEVVILHAIALAGTLAFGAVGGLLTWRDELLPDRLKAELRVLNMIPRWDWGWWILLTAMVALAIILEGSFKVRKRIEGERDVLKAHLDAVGAERTIDFMKVGLNVYGSGAIYSLKSVSVDIVNHAHRVFSFEVQSYELLVNNIPTETTMGGIFGGHIHHNTIMSAEVELRRELIVSYPLVI